MHVFVRIEWNPRINVTFPCRAVGTVNENAQWEST
jgi:hypothetical protein